MGKFENLVGLKFGRLTVLNERVEFIDCQGEKRFKWKCQCDCGNICYVVPSSLKSGDTRSCGCLQKEKVSTIVKEKNIKHGMSNSRLFKIWSGMKDRCYNPKTPLYRYYGGKGITICSEWLQSFELFYDWAISNGYTKFLSIDRIDVDGNYEPSNCRWVTQKVQCNNTTRNRYLMIGNQINTISFWAEYFEIPYTKVYSAYCKQQEYKNVQEFLSCLPKNYNERRKKVICENIVYDCAKSCAIAYQVNSGTMVQWLNGRRKMPPIWKTRGLSYIEEN